MNTDPVIVITSDCHCMVDGANWGQIADVMANNPKMAGAVNDALRAHLESVRQDATATVEAKRAELTASGEKLAAQLNEAREAHVSAAQAHQTAQAELQKSADALNDERKIAAAAVAAAKRVGSAAQSEIARAAALTDLIRKLPGELPAEVREAIKTDAEIRRARLHQKKAAVEAELAALPQS